MSGNVMNYSDKHIAVVFFFMMLFSIGSKPTIHKKPRVAEAPYLTASDGFSEVSIKRPLPKFLMICFPLTLRNQEIRRVYPRLCKTQHFLMTLRLARQHQFCHRFVTGSVPPVIRLLSGYVMIQFLILPISPGLFVLMIWVMPLLLISDIIR